MTRFRGFTRLMVAAILAGLLSGLGAILFHYLAETFGDALFRWAECNEILPRLPVVVIVPTIGLFCVGVILQIVPIAAYGGVPEVLEAIDHHSGVVPIRLLNVFLSGLVLAFGGSVGPEGPMVQLGAVAGSWVGQRFGLTKANLQTIVRAGVAAGIAAAFRSPAGGVLLTLEVFGARFNQDLTAISIAAGIGYVTRTALLGDAYPFRPAPMRSIPLSGLLLMYRSWDCSPLRPAISSSGCSNAFRPSFQAMAAGDPSRLRRLSGRSDRHLVSPGAVGRLSGD